jgi:hypothetical protein
VRCLGQAYSSTAVPAESPLVVAAGVQLERDECDDFGDLLVGVAQLSQLADPLVADLGGRGERGVGVR